MKSTILATLLVTGTTVSAFAPNAGINRFSALRSSEAEAAEVVAAPEQEATPEPVLASTGLLPQPERSPALPFAPRPMQLVGYAGDVGFDPLGLSEQMELEFLREAELKHGRIAMLATVGWISVDMGMRVYPVPEGWENISALQAHDAFVGGAMNADFWYSPLGFVLETLAILECFQVNDVYKMRVGEKVERVAGDLNFDTLGFLANASDEEVLEMKTKEVKHARLGMLAFMGIVMQSAYVGAADYPYF